MTETSGRLLKLLSLLQARRDWPGGELAQRLGVSGRTIRRDVERLRELGYPVDAVTGPAGGYRLHAGTAMPPLLLDDDEAVAIAVGLRTAAGASVSGIGETSIRALVKLEQVLPSHLRRRVNALSSVLATLPASGPMVDPEALTTIAGACRDHERLRFAYRDRDALRARRHVEPHSLVNLGRRWYLVAWDCEREGWRTFRVDRLKSPQLAGARFPSRPLPAADAAEFVAQSLSAMPMPHNATVVARGRVDAVGEVVGWFGAEVEVAGEDTCRIRLRAESSQWLDSMIAMIAVVADIEACDPPDVAGRIADLAGRLARANVGSST